MALIGRAAFCGVAAALVAMAGDHPAGAQQMEWHTGTYNDDTNGGRPTAYLVYGVAESDAVQFTANCPQGTNLETARAVLGYDVSRWREGEDVVVEFFAGGQQIYQKPAKVGGTAVETGISGVVFRPSPHDYFWQVLSQGTVLDYRVQGGATVPIEIRGAADPIRSFTDNCRSMLAALSSGGGGGLAQGQPQGAARPSPFAGARPNVAAPFGNQPAPMQPAPVQPDPVVDPRDAPSSGPSYSCTGGLTATERTICDDGELSRYDLQMADAYVWLSGQLGGAERDVLTRDQQQWLAERNGCGANTRCLLDRYLDRIAYLNEYLMPGDEATPAVSFPHAAKSWGGKVRSGPGIDYAQSGSLAEGEAITILERADAPLFQDRPWFLVSYRGGTGYHWGGVICPIGEPIDGTFEVCN